MEQEQEPPPARNNGPVREDRSAVIVSLPSPSVSIIPDSDISYQEEKEEKMNVPFLPMRAASPNNGIYELDDHQLSPREGDAEPLLVKEAGERGWRSYGKTRWRTGSIVAVGAGCAVVFALLVAISSLAYRQQSLSKDPEPIDLASSLDSNFVPFVPLSDFAPPPKPLRSSSEPFSELPVSWAGHSLLSPSRFASYNTSKYRPSPPKTPFPPPEYLAAAYEFYAKEHGGDDSYNSSTGRPLMVPRERLILSHENWTAPTVKVADYANEKNKGERFPTAQRKGKYGGEEEREEHRIQDEERRDWVKRTFLHAWEGYKEKAWGHDEVTPSGGGNGGHSNPYNGWGATIVDSLDVLLMMGLTRDYEYAREHVKSIDFSFSWNGDCFSMDLPPTLEPLSDGSHKKWSCQPPPTIQIFETVIRYLGGLLSAYELSHDTLMLDRAIELGNWLLPSLDTKLGLAIGWYAIGSLPGHDHRLSSVNLAEASSLMMEFTRLSMLTGDETYFKAIQRSTDTFDTHWSSEEETKGMRLGKLLPTSIRPDYPDNLYGAYTYGAGADSYYEYLLKMHVLLRGAIPQYKRMYQETLASAKKYLIKRIDTVPGWDNLTIIGETNGGGKSWEPRLQHLTCFAGGMIGLGARILGKEDDLILGLNITNACSWAYEAYNSGIGPEDCTFVERSDADAWKVVSQNIDGKRTLGIAPSGFTGSPLGVRRTSGNSMGRPETIESVFYMYRLTGDRYWQDRGWKMFTNWAENTIAEFGFYGLRDVNNVKEGYDDVMQSFVFAEHFKYYYLLFSPTDFFSLDDWVFNTEAHPFRHARTPSESLWKPTKDFKETSGPIGEGSFVQQWARVQRAAAT